MSNFDMGIATGLTSTQIAEAIQTASTTGEVIAYKDAAETAAISASEDAATIAGVVENTVTVNNAQIASIVTEGDTQVARVSAEVDTQVGLAAGYATSASEDAATTETNKNSAIVAANSATTSAGTVADDKALVAADKLTVATDKATVSADKGIVAGYKTEAAASASSAATSLANVPSAVDLAMSEADLESAAIILAKITGGMIVNRKDDNGNTNVMLKIPMFTNDAINAKLGTSFNTGAHPAFFRPDGSVMTHFEYAIYIASNDGADHPVSAPYKDAYTSIDFDTAKAKCEAMGTGWHLSSNAEWAAIVWLCLMNGWNPLGNTNYGQSHASLYQTAIRQDGLQSGDASGTARILAGTGPLDWRHNGQLNGIADLVGNVWEWQDGFKQENGQIIVAERNGVDEVNWIAQAAYYNGDNKLANAKTSDGTGISAVPWANQQKDANYITNPLLQSLLIEPVAATIAVTGKLYCNNTIVGFPMRGGNVGDGSNAGLGALFLSASRSNVSSSFGFRPAFFE